MVADAFGQKALALVDMDDAVGVIYGVDGGLTFAIGLLPRAGGARISPGGGLSASEEETTIWREKHARASVCEDVPTVT